MGFYGEVGSSRKLDTEHLAIGVIGRYHLLEGDLRPYVEGRLGYRYTWQDRERGHGIDSGAGLGLEYSLGGGASIFAQVDYSYGTAEFRSVDSEISGPGFKCQH